MGSDESHFNVSLITVRDKVTRQCPQTTISELNRKKSRSGFEPRDPASVKQVAYFANCCFDSCAEQRPKEKQLSEKQLLMLGSNSAARTTHPAMKTPSCSSSVLFHVHRNHEGLLGTGSPGMPPRLSHSS